MPESRKEITKMETLWIEAEAFQGNTIFGAKVPPYGYGLEHVTDINTELTYTIIFKGDKRYSYLENEDGSLQYNY